MTTPVSFETSKLLKEKGFNIPTLYFYLDGSLKYNHSIKPRNSNVLPGTMDVSAPTIAEVVMWLYEKYKIWIFCDKTIIWFWTIQKQTNEYIQQEDLDEKFSNSFNSPTEAYEAAIEYTLKNLI